MTAAARWWRKNRTLAPQAFDEDLAEFLAVLPQVPLLGALALNERLPNVRRALLERISYYVYYRYDEAQQRITVLTFWHARRQPPKP